MTAAMLALGLVLQAPKESMQRYRPQMTHCSVKSPGAVHYSVVDAKVKGHGVKIHQFDRTEKFTGFFVLNYVEYPEGLKLPDPTTWLTGVREEQVDQRSGRRISTRPIKLGNVPGLAYEYEVDRVGDLPERVVHQRTYLAGRRLYQLLVFGEPGQFTDSYINEFLDSLQIDPT